MRRKVLLVLWCLGSVAHAVVPNALSTTFVDVVVPSVALGEPVTLHDAAGRHFLVMNGGSRPIRVEIIPEQPTLAECRLHAKPIPDAAWLSAEPRVLEIPPNSYKEARLTLLVPDEPRYKGKNYQIMVRAVRLPDQVDKSVQIIQALRVRVIFQTPSKSR
jgi:hypothetical protein